jgi:uncharacterized protein Yka (UPF0111/DUF47 family)
MVNSKEVIEKAKWYLKYRTQLWATVFMFVGLIGGNVDRIKNSVPTLKYDTTTMENKLNDIEKNLEKIEKVLDSLQKSGV